MLLIVDDHLAGLDTLERTLQGVMGAAIWSSAKPAQSSARTPAPAGGCQDGSADDSGRFRTDEQGRDGLSRRGQDHHAQRQTRPCGAAGRRGSTQQACSRCPDPVRDEAVHRDISGLPEEWNHDAIPALPAAQITDQSDSARAHELRDVLTRNSVPHLFLAADSEEGGDQLRQAGQDGSALPVPVTYTRQVITNSARTGRAVRGCLQSQRRLVHAIA